MNVQQEIEWLKQRVEAMDETLAILRALHVVEIAEHKANLEAARRKINRLDCANGRCHRPKARKISS
jgi:hypothetical protein